MFRKGLLLVFLLMVSGCSSVNSLTDGDSREPAAENSQDDIEMTAKELGNSSSFGPNEIALLQVNDVYEVEPSEAGTRGGLARFATIRERLTKVKAPPIQNAQRVLAVLPGDFISPSAIGASKELSNGPTYNKGDFVSGRHMVAGLRAAGMDIVTFGNHEFDVSNKRDPKLIPVELVNRIKEFTAPRPLQDDRGRRLTANSGTLTSPKWLAGNVRLNDTQPPSLPEEFKNSEQPFIWETSVILDKEPTLLRVGFMTVCVPTNKPYNSFEMPAGAKNDVFESAERQIKSLEDQGVNAIVALTHQSMETDKEFASRFRNRVHLVIGGHEHDRQFAVFPRRVQGEMKKLMVTKADANAKSAYIHRFAFGKVGNKIVPIASRSSWIAVDTNIPHDPEVRKITQVFESMAKESFRQEPLTEKLPYAPDHVIWSTVNNLDGRESKIRTQKTHLSELIGRSLTAKAYRIYKEFTPNAQPMIGAIYHGGTIRIDDKLMSPTGLLEVADRKALSEDLQTCQSPKNCVPLGSDRCEKIVRCPGEVTEYDILRVSPFAETVLTWVQLTGEQIYNLYECNDKDSGSGSYLQFSNIFICSDKKALCTLAQDPAGAEFDPTPTEVPLELKGTYTVASLDFMTHIMLANKPGYKNAPMFPEKIVDQKGKKNPAWVIQNDIRRILIEEPAANKWVARVRSEKGVETTLGYGPQPPLEGPFKNQKCK